MTRPEPVATADHLIAQWRDVVTEAMTRPSYFEPMAKVGDALAAALEARDRRIAVLEAGLREAKDALRANVTTWIALEHHLDTPYPDDPRWTPWTRFGHRAMTKAGDALTKARDLLAGRAAGGADA